CGAQVRPGARFCNVCGARQPLVEQLLEQEAQSAQEAPAAEPGEGSERVKRPPRTPRADDTAGEQDVTAAAGSTVTTAQLPEPASGGRAPGVSGSAELVIEPADGAAIPQQTPKSDEAGAAMAGTDVADQQPDEGVEERPEAPPFASADAANQDMPALE